MSAGSTLPPPLPEAARVPEAPPALPPAPGRRAPLLVPAAVVLLGAILLGLVGYVESMLLKRAPWSETVVKLGEADSPESTLPVYTRKLPLDQIPGAEAEAGLIEAAAAGDRALLENLGLDRTETVVAVEGEVPWSELLSEGRAPEPGSNEVVAGMLARVDTFTLDEETFTVVGRFSPAVGGLAFAYALTYTPEKHAKVFRDSDAARAGWLFPAGFEDTREVVSLLGGPGSLDDPDRRMEVGQQLHAASFGGNDDLLAGSFTWPGVKWAVWALLVGIAIAGSWFYINLFQRMAPRALWPTRTLCSAMAEMPRLWVGLHVFLFGVFAVSMAFGMLQPLQNLRVMGMVTGIFTEGELQYVQEAYQSGNVFRAAAATFVNNYVYQTLVLTLGISLLPFAPGVFKTIMSFGLVGFAMAPNAVGTANGYSFHSLTMVFELEAYVVACFCALYWARQFFLASYHRDLRAAGRGLSVMVGGVLVTAIMLAFAALYEAASLIGAGMLAEMGSAL